MKAEGSVTHESEKEREETERTAKGSPQCTVPGQGAPACLSLSEIRSAHHFRMGLSISGQKSIVKRLVDTLKLNFNLRLLRVVGQQDCSETDRFIGLIRQKMKL